MKIQTFTRRRIAVALIVLLNLFVPAQRARAQELPPVTALELTPDSKVISNIMSDFYSHLNFSRYDELEKAAAEFRASKDTLVTGEWKLDALYEGTTMYIRFRNEQALPSLNNLKEWAKERPKSITAQVALANGLVRYAWAYRGGLVRSASDEQMQVFEESLAEARLVLREAKKLPEKCPYWWVVAQKVAQAQGWDRKTYDGLFAEAIQFEPGCEQYYYEKAGYILVNWVGIDNEWQKYALAAADKIGGEKGDILYARIIWHMDRQRHIGQQYENAAISFQRVDRGFEALLKRHPDSLMVMNAWARLCRMVGSNEFSDRRKARARELYTKIGAHADSWVWPKLTDFQNIRDATFDIPNYHDLGFEKLKKGDNEGAIADITKAIERYPLRPEAFSDRGLAKLNLHQTEAALADFNRATHLSSKFFTPPDSHRDSAAFYVNQALGLIALEKWDLAIKSATRAIELNPNIYQAYLNRGRARYGSGDLKGALEDFAEVIAQEPEEPVFYSERAFMFYNSQMWKESLGDFREFISMAEPEVNTEYQRIYIWLIRARLGEKAAASQELKAHLAKQKKPNEWSSKVGAFLIGELPEAALLAEAADKDPVRVKEKQTEAFFYIGMKHLLAGEKTPAAEYFQKVLDLKLVSFMEFASAKAELKLLKAPDKN